MGDPEPTSRVTTTPITLMVVTATPITTQVETSLALTTTLDPDTHFTREAMESLSMRIPTKGSETTLTPTLDPAMEDKVVHPDHLAKSKRSLSFGKGWK